MLCDELLLVGRISRSPAPVAGDGIVDPLSRDGRSDGVSAMSFALGLFTCCIPRSCFRPCVSADRPRRASDPCDPAISASDHPCQCWSTSASLRASGSRSAPVPTAASSCFSIFWLPWRQGIGASHASRRNDDLWSASSSDRSRRTFLFPVRSLRISSARLFARIRRSHAICCSGDCRVNCSIP